MTKRNIVDLAFDESEDIIIKYLDLFKQEVIEEQLKVGYQKKDYYQGMIDGLVRFKCIIKPQNTKEADG